MTLHGRAAYRRVTLGTGDVAQAKTRNIICGIVFTSREKKVKTVMIGYPQEVKHIQSTMSGDLFRHFAAQSCCVTRANDSQPREFDPRCPTQEFRLLEMRDHCKGTYDKMDFCR